MTQICDKNDLIELLLPNASPRSGRPQIKFSIKITIKIKFGHISVILQIIFCVSLFAVMHDSYINYFITIYHNVLGRCDTTSCNKLITDCLCPLLTTARNFRILITRLCPTLQYQVYILPTVHRLELLVSSCHLRAKQTGSVEKLQQ